MSTLKKRVEQVEERTAFEDFKQTQREFEGRPREELEFFAVYGYWPDSLSEDLPERREFTVNRVRIVITAERAFG